MGRVQQVVCGVAGLLVAGATLGGVGSKAVALPADPVDLPSRQELTFPREVAAKPEFAIPSEQSVYADVSPNAPAPQGVINNQGRAQKWLTDMVQLVRENKGVAGLVGALAAAVLVFINVKGRERAEQAMDGLKSLERAEIELVDFLLKLGSSWEYLSSIRNESYIAILRDSLVDQYEYNFDKGTRRSIAIEETMVGLCQPKAEEVIRHYNAAVCQLHEEAKCILVNLRKMRTSQRFESLQLESLIRRMDGLNQKRTQLLATVESIIDDSRYGIPIIERDQVRVVVSSGILSTKFHPLNVGGELRRVRSNLEAANWKIRGPAAKYAWELANKALRI